MDSFSITEAAFTGFRIVRRRPRAVIVWAVIQLAVSLAVGGVMAAMAGPDLMRLQGLGAAAAQITDAELLALFGRLGPAFGVIAIFALVFNPLLYAAMNRAVMRPADDRFGYFRLGADEARQLGLMLLKVLVVLGGYMAVVLIAFAAAAAFGSLSKPAAGLAVALVALAGVGAAVFVAVRLSLASAQTFATARVTLFGSWALTRGRFWPILGTYVLADAFAAVVYLLWFVLTFAIVAAIGGLSGVASVMRPDLSSLAAFLTPAALALSVPRAIVAALLWPLVATPPAAIHQRLTAPESIGATV